MHHDQEDLSLSRFLQEPVIIIFFRTVVFTELDIVKLKLFPSNVIKDQALKRLSAMGQTKPSITISGILLIKYWQLPSR